MFATFAKFISRFTTRDSNNDVGVWFDGNKNQAALIEGMDAQGGMYFTIYQKEFPTRDKCHNLVIGIRPNGRPFLQACNDNDVETVDLIDFIRKVNQLSQE